MKKKSDDMPAEYDPELIRAGVRGKYAERYKKGTNVILLAPDVAKAFPDAGSVNDALRMLMKIAQSTAQVR